MHIAQGFTQERRIFDDMMINKRFCWCIVTAICYSPLLWMQPAWSQPAPAGWQALTDAAHKAIAAEFAASADRIEIELPTADPRQTIPVCALPLETSLGRHNGQGGRLSVRVDCRDQSPWSRNISTMVKVYRQVVVSTRNLGRGDILNTNDIELKEVDVSQARGTLLQDLTAAEGLVTRRNITSGTALSSDMLSAPLLVRRGDTVILTAERGGVSIRQQGTALQDGEAGRQIQVRNTRSNRVVQAVVTGQGEASVIF